ncbi:MAG: adenine deaminase C-terminal domain-containing protein [Bacillota bacterium]
MQLTITDRINLIKVSRGEQKADLYIQGGKLINVYSGEIYPANVAIAGDRIAYVGNGSRMVGPDTEVVNASSYYLSPGYIEPHGHPWFILNPVSLASQILPLGLTTMMADNLPFYLLGKKPFISMVQALRRLPLCYFWLIRVVPQSLTPDENAMFNRDKLSNLLRLPEVTGIAEITRWPDIMTGDEQLLETITAALQYRLRVEGHTAGASYEKLNPVIAGGIMSCHESITAQEVIDRLRLGLWVILRHSSLREDLPELLLAVTRDGVDPGRLMLTTDAPNPLFTREWGFMDGLLRTAVTSGLHPVQALKMITINPAMYYRLDDHLGGIGPGKIANILLLPDLDTFKPEMVIAKGKVVARNGHLTTNLPDVDWTFLGLTGGFKTGGWAGDPRLFSLHAREGQTVFPVIDLFSNVITRRIDMELPVQSGEVKLPQCGGFLYCALLDPRGRYLSKGIIHGLASNLEGMASSFNTTGHIFALGNNHEAMAQASQRVVDIQGGIVLVEGGLIKFELPLPLVGMMSTGDPHQVLSSLKEFTIMMKERGYPHGELLYSLLFLTGDFLPGLRLTPMGLYDVKTRELIYPSESLT